MYPSHVITLTINNKTDTKSLNYFTNIKYRQVFNIQVFYFKYRQVDKLKTCPQNVYNTNVSRVKQQWKLVRRSNRVECTEIANVVVTTERDLRLPQERPGRAGRAARAAAWSGTRRVPWG